MSDTEPKKEEDFKLIDFDGNPIQSDSLNNFEPDSVKLNDPEKSTFNISDIKAQNPVATPSVIQKVGNQSIEVKQISSVEELTPEMQSTIKKLFKSVLKDEMKQLVNDVETKRDIMFDKNNDKSAFGKLSVKEQDLLKEKMTEWNVPEELSNINASVILSWVNNTIRENK